MVEMFFCTTCYERPPVLRDRFCWAEGVVAQDRFYCIWKKWDREKVFTMKGCSLTRGVHYKMFHCIILIVITLNISEV